MAQATATKTILVIDDDEVSRWLLQLCLEHFVDRQISVAILGKQELTEIAKAKPDLILLEIVMPDTDGYTFIKFIKKLKAIDSLAHIPIVLLTASTKRFSHQTFIDLGCQCVINKPCNTSILGSQISKVLGW